MVVQRTYFNSVRYQIVVLREILVICIFLFLTAFNTFASITINNNFNEFALFAMYSSEDRISFMIIFDYMQFGNCIMSTVTDFFTVIS
jgi:hypothetical protein